MGEILRYSEETQDQFDQRTRVVLDALQQRFGAVELHAPGGSQKDWFVAIWKEVGAELPTGFFGRDPYSAAIRLARAFGLEIDLNDTDPI